MLFITLVLTVRTRTMRWQLKIGISFVSRMGVIVICFINTLDAWHSFQCSVPWNQIFGLECGHFRNKCLKAWVTWLPPQRIHYKWRVRSIVACRPVHTPFVARAMASEPRLFLYAIRAFSASPPICWHLLNQMLRPHLNKRLLFFLCDPKSSSIPRLT